MAEKTFRCRLITPEAQVLDGPVVSAVIPCWDGQMGILVDRAPIVTKLGVGELRLDFPSGSGGGGSRAYLVEGGFAHMLANSLTILAERATPEEQINESEAQKELTAAETRLAGAAEGAEQERAKRDKDRALRRVQAARAFKARGGGI